MDAWKTDMSVSSSCEKSRAPSTASSAASLALSQRSLKPGEKFRNTKGLGWFVTGLFVVGDLAGGGIVALPTALIQTGFYPGLVIMALMTAVTTFTSYVLGQTWAMLLEKWPEYRHHTRKPYAEIGFRAHGPWMRTFVSIIINITQFMIAVVYTLLSSKNIQDFIEAFFGVKISYCLVILAVAVCLLPVTFLKSPNDFWWAVVIAMFTTSAAVILIIVGASMDYGACHPSSQLPPFRVTNYFLALGTFLFSYGGHTAFPTIQHDMRCPADFNKSTFVAFTILALMYTPTGIVGVLTYGDSLRDSVINSIQVQGIQQAINVLITVHLILTLTIVFNPVNQEIEDLFHVPQQFSWQRVCVRTSVLFAAAFVAESVPSFGPLLNLVGGSTLTLSSICFPCLFFLFIKARLAKARENGKDVGPASFNDVITYNSKPMIAACVFVIVFGFIGGAAATFSAIRDLSSARFELPCYVSAFMANTDDATVSATNCCGAYQNLTARANVTCTTPDLDFYTK